MERKFYTDNNNFEQFLKEATDNFRMYPSKKVWHSIYNDLHPDRKWPSLAIWLLLISSITYIGLINKNTNTQKLLTAQHSANEQFIPQRVADNRNNNKPGNITLADNTIPSMRVSVGNKQGIDHSTPFVATKTIASDSRMASLSNSGSGIRVDHSRNSVGRNSNYNSLHSNTNQAGARMSESGTTTDIDKTEEIAGPSPLVKPFSLAELMKSSAPEKTRSTAGAGKTTLNLDKEWIEDYALHNKPTISKWKTKVTYQLYATPSIGYRSLDKTANIDLSNNSSLVANNNSSSDLENTINQSAAFNMEAGGGILYTISKMIRFKAGLQFNYTSYTINANELRHPTLTTLAINDINNGYPELISRSASISNTPGEFPKKINNNTYQISLPIGADFRIAGQKRLQWFAGITLQPSYIAGGNSYLLSADMKNYVSDPSFIRRWNLNAGVETFLSYKIKNGLMLNAGPQLRYQLLSTYNKQYSFSEKLYNLGIKMGITTSF